MVKRGKKNNHHHSSFNNGWSLEAGNALFIEGRSEYNPHINMAESSWTQEELCSTTQMHVNAAKQPRGHNRGNFSRYSSPRGGGPGLKGRGKGRRGFNTSTPNGNFSDRGRYSSPAPREISTSYGGKGSGRGRGISAPVESESYLSPHRGRGIGSLTDLDPVVNKRLGSCPTLSESLNASRPLLRPVTFVRSNHTPFLFMHDQEEILKPVAEDVGEDEASHFPTADRVEKIFHGDIGECSTSYSSEDDNKSKEEEEEVEEIDVNDLKKLTVSLTCESTTTPIATIIATKAKKVKIDGVLQMVEDQVNTGLYQRPQFSTPRSQTSPFRAGTPVSAERRITENEFIMGVNESSPCSQKQQPDKSLFFVNTQPDFVSSIPSTTALQPAVIPPPDDDEEIIVYVAPHPRVHMMSGSGNKLYHKDANHADTSVFEPYNPHTALSLASMTLQDPESTAPGGQPLDPGPALASSTPLVQDLSTSGVEVSANTIPAALFSLETASVSSVPLFAPSELAPAPVVVSHPTVASLEKFNFNSFNPLRTPNHKSPDNVSPRIAKKQKARTETRHQRMKARRRGAGFAVYGALVDDTRLYDSSEHQKWGQRRRGDSDLDWGTDEEGDSDDGPCLEEKRGYCNPEDGSKPVSEKAQGEEKAQSDANVDDHGMVVDLELDVQAMEQFISGLTGDNARAFMTMKDIENAKKLKKEDEEGAGVVGGTVGSSDSNDSDDNDEVNDDDEANDVVDEKEEIEEVLKLGERLLIGENSNDSDDDDELDLSPKSTFQARLERLRAKARAKKPHDEDDDENMLEEHMVWAGEDGDEYHDDDNYLISKIQDILDTNVEIADSRSRKQRNKFFRTKQNGSFDVDTAGIQPARKRNDKYKDLPSELLDQWELDRKRKAEHKCERELKKLINATDPFTKKKGGKKGRKAMRKIASIDPATISLGPNRIIDITTLIQQIRRFINNLDGPSTMSLPPANKETRKNVHELAIAFGLTSRSKGKGDARYTTLTKTSRTCVGRVDEWKIHNVVSRTGRKGARGDSFGEFGDEREKKGNRVPKHKEGDKVGASAPKIGEENLGFKMLAAMGWTEGNKIGLSGGLDAPLAATIKHTKLGLGAAK